MSKLKILLMSHGSPLLVVFIIGLFLFWPTFSLALYGDEWQMLWFAKAIMLGKYQLLPTDIWPAYWNEMAIFNLLSQLFGYEGRSYYIFSFICRLGASITFYWFTYKLFSSKLLAFLASLFFLISPIGIEATDWVRNFDSYLGIGLFIAGLYVLVFFKNFTSLLWLVLIFLGIVLINPLRAHGVFLTYSFLIGLQFIAAILSKSKKNGQLFLITGILLGGLFYLLVLLGVFGGLAGGRILGENFDIYQGLRSGIYSFGNIYIPNFDQPALKLRLILFILMAVFFCLPLLVISKKSIRLAVFFTYFGIMGFMIYNLVFLARQSSLFITAFFLLIFCLWLIFFFINKQFHKVVVLATGFCLSTAFMVYPLLRQSWFEASFEHRYLIYSALAAPFLLTFFLNFLSRHTKLRISGIFLVSLIIFFNGIISYKYLQSAKQSHSQPDCQSLRYQVFDQVRNVDFSNQKFFWFKVLNPEEESRVYNCLTFGFMFLTGIEFQLWDINVLPVAVYENPEGIKSMLTDGKTTAKYVGVNKKIAPHDLLVFEVEKGNVQLSRFDY